MPDEVPRRAFQRVGNVLSKRTAAQDLLVLKTSAFRNPVAMAMLGFRMATLDRPAMAIRAMAVMAILATAMVRMPILGLLNRNARSKSVVRRKVWNVVRFQTAAVGLSLVVRVLKVSIAAKI